MQVLGSKEDGVWINKSGWKESGQGHKYYTLEADFKIIKVFHSNFAATVKYCKFALSDIIINTQTDKNAYA